MKKILLGVALVGLAYACKSEEKAQISDAQPMGANCAAECTKPCDEASKECSMKSESADCSMKAKTCPMTGKVEG